MTHRGSEADYWIKGSINLQLCNFKDGAACGEMGQEEVDTQFLQAEALAGILLHSPRQCKSMSSDPCLGPAPGLGLPKLKGTTAEQSTSKETLLHFPLHITFFSAINKQKTLLCTQKSKDLFLQSLHTLKQTFLAFHYPTALSHAVASPLQGEDTSEREPQGLSKVSGQG